MTQHSVLAAQIIQERLPAFRPRLAIVLGSGLGALVEEIAERTVIPYAELPGFHTPQVEGQAGNLILGLLEGVPVACLQGRAHYYEGVNNEAIQTMVRTLKLLGCETWLATNAAGSLRETVGPGSLVLVTDHINFQFNCVLAGPNCEDFGPRFIGMENAYDSTLRKAMQTVAAQMKITLEEGVYVGVLGPAFETPAEIRAFRLLGADVVGMSTIPEVVSAVHCGMKVVVVSVVTNLAAGMGKTIMTHQETLQGAALGAEKLVQLIRSFVRYQYG